MVNADISTYIGSEYPAVRKIEKGLTA